MSFFYDLNKKLQQVLESPKSEHKQLNEGWKGGAAGAGVGAVAGGPVGAAIGSVLGDKIGDELGETGYSARAASAGRDIGKPGKNFAKIAKSAGERYGSKERGEAVAGAVLKKLRAKNEGVDSDAGDDNRVSTVVRLLKRLLTSEALRDAYDIGEDDVFQIEELAAALENNDMEAAQDAWSVFDVNELDNALDSYVADNGLETGYLFDLLGHNVNEGSKVPTDWMGVPTKLGKNDKKPIQFPAGYDEYIKQGAKHGFQDDPNNPLRKRVKKAGVAEGRHTQSNALELNPDLRAQANKPTVAGRIGSAAKRVANAITGGSDEDAKNRLLNRMGGRRTPLARDDMSEATKEIPGGRRHTSEPGGYGRKDDDEAPKAKTQRGRGRPKKGGDSETGEVKKYDWSAFGATGKDVKLPKHSGTVTKHKMSDEEPKKKVKEATKEIPGGRRHTADAGGYGRRDDEDDKGKRVAAQVKRGRGRPKKGGDSETGEVKKYDWSAFGATGKEVKLPKHKGNVTRHKMDEAVSEDDLAVLERLMDQAFAEGNTALGNDIQGVIERIQGDQDEGQYDDEPVNEKAVSKKQQRFMGMVHAAQKGEKPASKEVAKVAKEMPKKEAEKFAKTKQKGLPEKKQATDETSDSKPAKGGMTFGKGIYDSMNRELESMIAESMSVNLSMNDDGHGGPRRSLTVTATDDDATKLAELLKMAGIGDESSAESSDCGCDELEENQADWPTDAETSNDPFQYSGGLNGPKSTGQTTGAPFNRQPQRQGAMVDEEDELARMMEMAGVKKGSKPDYVDLDKDGNKTEPMKQAAKDAKEDSADQVDEGILGATRNLWKTYQG